MLPEIVCEAVQMANNYGAVFHILVHEESFRYNCCGERQPIYPKALPTMTVSQLIECGFLKSLRGFHLKDRWILALKLAQSLLQLHNGPWLQTLWTSETLFFLCENSKGGSKLRNIHSPFISCIISDSPPSLPKPSHFDKYPLLLTFGQFLLELANGEKLPVTKTKTGDFSPYMTLKNNFNEMNTGSLSDDYKEAIKGCLDFHKFLKDERGPDEEVRIRTTIFKKIVMPLENNLRLFSKAATSADISINRTEEIGPTLDVPDLRDPHPKDSSLLATPHVSSPLSLRTSHSPAPGRTWVGQVKSLEPSSCQLPAPEFSTSYAARVEDSGIRSSLKETAEELSLTTALSIHDSVAGPSTTSEIHAQSQRTAWYGPSSFQGGNAHLGDRYENYHFHFDATPEAAHLALSATASRASDLHEFVDLISSQRR